MYLDSIDSIVFSIKRKTGESHSIFPTALLTHNKSIIVPLAFVLSEENDAPYLTLFLSDWIRSGTKPPKFITTYMSKALQNAVCLAFNKMPFGQYNDTCISILENESTEQIELTTKTYHIWWVLWQNGLALLISKKKKWNSYF